MIRSVRTGISRWPLSPARTTLPPCRAASSASETGPAAKGVSSSTTSAIAPLVIWRTRSTVFSAPSPSTTMVWSAPNSRATASLCASAASPVMMIVLAPAARAATTEAMPRWPAPSTSTVSPSCTSPRWQAQRTPAPSALYIAASSAGRLLSILCSTEVGDRYMYSASPPHNAGSVSTLVTPWPYLRWRQNWYRPVRQSWQDRHGTITSTATRSPGWTSQRSAARSPISSMIPSGSWPGMKAGLGPPRWPRKVSTSLPQMPLASTRSRPSSGPIRGRGNSRSSIFPGPVWTAARTMSVICSPVR